MRTLKAKESYKEWITSLLKFVTPLNDPKPLSIEIINDTSKADSVKSGTRYKRGEPTKRIHIRSWDQTMVKGKIGNRSSTALKTNMISLISQGHFSAIKLEDKR